MEISTQLFSDSLPEGQESDDQDEAAGAIQPEPGRVCWVSPEGCQQEGGGTQEGQDGHLFVEAGPPVQHQCHVNVHVVVACAGVIVVYSPSLDASDEVPSARGEVVHVDPGHVPSIQILDVQLPSRLGP